MDFLLMGILLWSLVIAALVLALYGMWKRSWQALFWAAVASLLPMGLIFMGDDGWVFKLAVLPPLLLFVGAFFLRQREPARR
ncbi:hypothetical protein [Planococcus dechangensis]|uniref:Uncharacterized protein n=1 Tax=Planococcus dechangensis TaxID=1176255 RepID=A0ABV9MCT7_9BACL